MHELEYQPHVKKLAPRVDYSFTLLYLTIRKFLATCVGLTIFIDQSTSMSQGLPIYGLPSNWHRGVGHVSMQKGYCILSELN